MNMLLSFLDENVKKIFVGLPIAIITCSFQNQNNLNIWKKTKELGLSALLVLLNVLQLKRNYGDN